MSTLGRLTRKYSKDQRGQFAVIFALIAMPLIVAVAYVSDLTYAGKVKAELKGSLDSAALAAVINQKFTEGERAKFATNHFNENFELSDTFKLDVVNASAERVELAATGSFPSYIGAITGNDKFEINASAASVLTEENIICMLALDPDGEGALTVSGDGNIFASNCAVQVNSTHDRAAIVESGSSVNAKSICVSGGATGRYSPFVNTECSRIEDPYASKKFVDDQPCTFTQRIKNNQSAQSLESATSGISIAGNKAVLSPGVYCEDVRIVGKDVVFLPGSYTFRDSRLWFRDGSTVTAEEVTFIFTGKKSELRLDQQSVLTLKAPKIGPMAGLAVYQSSASMGNKQNKMTAITRFKGDSTLIIVGTVYMPNSRIVIANGASGNIKNDAFSYSPATSFIGYQVHVESATARVAIDHKTAGLPPMLPRADEGARLVE